MSKFYTVHDTGQNLLKVVDNETGAQAGMISPRGKLVTPPIVTRPPSCQHPSPISDTCKLVFPNRFCYNFHF